jgi:NAD(P)-dependent dehydrogenase (short-subunit alcohol dehydrogenase family)
MTKAALIVGVESEAGRVVARHLCRQGLAIVAAGPPSGEAAAVVRALVRQGGEAVTHIADVTKPEGAGDAVARTVELFGGLEALILSSTAADERSVLRLDQATWDGALRDHLSTTMFCCQAAVRWMLEARHAGSVICLTSSEGLRARRFGQAHGAVVSGGICGLVRAMGLELRHKGVTINGVTLEQWEVDSTAADSRDETSSEPHFESLPPLISFLTSDLAREITGQVICLEGQRLSILRTLDTVGALAPVGGWTPDDIARRWSELAR